jgi:hypothetical protein
MRRIILAAGVAQALALAGCATGPLADNPLRLRPAPNPVENPVVVSPGQPGPAAYADVFEKVLSVVTEYFEISYANRYDGRIETYPKIAPGLEQPWRPGSPDSRERLLATVQSMRNRCFVRIEPNDQGGYLVQVTVFRELEDVPRPDRQSAGVASFRDATTVDRSFEVIDQSVLSANWIPKGRDTCFEQALLQKIQKCQ